MDLEMSSANWSSSAMRNNYFNNSLNAFENDRNLINWSIICSNDNISDVNEECLQWLTIWDSRQRQLIEVSSEATTFSNSSFNAMSTMGSTVFDDLFSFNATVLSTTESLIPVYKWPFLLLGLLVFIGGFGNILVCLAIGFERRLQNATNYFLLSLAVADLLVSVVVMPFGILNEFYGIWPFGSTICNLWVTCDVLCCSSSILHMCFISVGRYIGIKNPLHARQAPLLVSRRAVLLKIVLAWLLSAVITSPITILAIVDRSNIQPEPLICAIANRPFLILGSLSAFFLPMIVMVNSYVLTVRLLRRKAKFYQDSCHNYSTTSGKESSEFNSSNRNASSSVKDHYSVNRTISSSSNSSENSATSGNLQLVVNQCSTPQLDLNRVDSRSLNSLSAKRWESQSIRAETNPFKKKSNSRKTQPLMLRTLGSSLQVRNEQKATKVLGVVFFAFVICWAPFFVLNVTFGVLPRDESSRIIPDEVTTTFLWLGYISSTINPIIYTIFNRNFRRAFKRILMCKICANDSVPNRRFSRTASQMREPMTASTHRQKRSSASPTHTSHTHTSHSHTSHSHQTSSKLCDISTSFIDSKKINESNSRNSHHTCHNLTYYYNKPLHWKFKTSLNSRNNNGLTAAQHDCNKECSL